MKKSEIKQLIKTIILSLIIVFAMGIWTLQPQVISYQTLLNNSCDKLWINAPSNVKPNETFQFHVQAWDDWERLSSTYEGIVSFDLISYNLKNLTQFISTRNLPISYQYTGAFFEQGLIPGYKLAGLTGKDCGKHSFSGFISEEGIHYINVSDNLGNFALSNPIIVKNNTIKKLYWGDIHGHSALCDGSGYLEEVWRFSKEVAYLDFASITTHDDWTDYYGISPNFGTLWEISRSSANRWNAPNDFVALLSYEWTQQLRGYGHMCVYYKGSVGEMFSSSYPEYFTQDQLWDALREWKTITGSDVITIPHHTGHSTSAMWFDWSYYDPEFVPLVEIYSAHGSSEKINGLKTIKPSETKTHGHHVQDALAMGYQIGFMASGDSHDGRIGHSILHTEANNRFQYPSTMMGLVGSFRFGEEYPNGLIGVYAENLTRANIFDSLKSRACYATTHVSRPFINFTINGISVGQNDSIVYIPTPTSQRNISLFIAADGNFVNNTIQNITLVRNNIDIDFETPYTLIYRYNYTDTTEITGMNYTYGIEENGQYKINKNAHISLPEYSIDQPPSTNWNGTDYSEITDLYYIRILQKNGNMAWIGPIWVKIK